MNLFESSINDSPFLRNKGTNEKGFNNSINIVDLFAGIGGFHYGISAAASEIEHRTNPVLVSEIIESNQNTYRSNFKCNVEGDINKINLNDYSNKTVDILTAGFPCQPFSNSGKKLGLSDPRGQFYFRIEEIIKYLNPKSFILENVPGIKTNGGGSYNSKLSYSPMKIGETMKFLEDNLENLKEYHIKWIELDSSKFGSPQVRKRIYIIGIHKDFTNSLELNFNIYDKKCFMDIAEDIINPNLELSTTQDSNVRSFMNTAPSYNNGMRRVGQAYLCKGGNVGQTYHAFGLVPTLTVVWSKFYPIYFPHSEEVIPSINNQKININEYYGKGYIRKASIREVLRLQGFPDEFIPHQNKNIAYEQAGNAVNTKVVKAISKILLKYIIK